MTPAQAAPSWVRALSTVVRRLPRGRYQLVASIRSSAAPFVGSLAADLRAPRFICDLSDEIAREVCLTGYYEPPVTRLMQRRLHAGGAMVDVGANWGYFSLLAAAAVGTAGHVIALEPDPRQFRALDSNIQLNGFTHVRAIREAAAATAGRALLLGYPEDAANRGVSRLGQGFSDRPSFEVDCATVDRVASTLPRVDAIKIDVEGAEIDVLRGMGDGLASHRYRSIFLELHPEQLADRGESVDGCLHLLLDAGYRGWTIDQSPRSYRRAVDPDLDAREILQPLDGWRTQAWPHVLWLAAGEDLT
jgi:FkbM family methyltransferase